MQSPKKEALTHFSNNASYLPNHVFKIHATIKHYKAKYYLISLIIHKLPCRQSTLDYLIGLLHKENQ
ncbi:hypothetical protein FEDK69T_16070 [Flavobacterium enshiense DK69]|uniref:Uncharacterized protein n=1 Tax=Flavobacterium enshiense DK69 TaxID=1107311 RepID=V6S9V9_9FLAO|nr:hypothetical protein [Flavobacterium enshiense]ESU23441.1 hypothetical protein FEDK69T_16070 [Flavobacterium enshiense DK69]KGO96336.1 hypothetical protein Q767_05325 [Flavobacterium enshiense DK69]